MGSTFQLQLPMRRQEIEELAKAEQLFLEVIRRNPNESMGLHLFALLKLAEKNYQDAVAFLRAAIEKNPQDAQIHYHLANAYLALQQPKEAFDESQIAADLDPNFAEAFCNLGICLRKFNKHEKALEALQKSIHLKPKCPIPYMHLGNTLGDLEQWHDALEAYSRGIELNPNIPEPYSNRANVYKDLGRFKEAGDDYKKAIQLMPDFKDAHVNYAILLLTLGQFDRGWEEYEWRLYDQKLENPVYEQRFWDGRPIPEKLLWLHAEQGFGDVINFVRFAKLVRPYCGRLLVSVPSKLKRLLKRVEGPDVLLSMDDPAPAVHFHAPFMSIPALLKCYPEKTAAEVPYIHAEPELVQKWKERLDAVCGITPRIGLCWQGNKDFPGDRDRSIPLKKFEKLFEREGVQFVSLQKGYGEQQIKENGLQGRIIDWTNEMDTGPDAFVDMAAFMKNLDLVISVDTSIAHLAGALAMPVWMLVPFIPDWRWLWAGESSYWYPTMRIFRQPRKKDWDSVFVNLERVLCEKPLLPRLPRLELETSPMLTCGVNAG